MNHELNQGHCDVCCGTPDAITEECPGRELTRDEAQLVAAGRLDYWDGTWHRTGGSDDE